MKNKIQQYSWGLYPKIKCKSLKFTEINELRNIVTKENHIIAHGNGRSYGDSALNKKIIDCTAYNKVISFDKERGTLKAQAGILLDDILELIIPEGWFLKVTPGTKMITLGGAIASDVHGKNHHIDGCFSESVLNFSIMDKEGIIKKCLKSDELFLSTCGGMGLTGVIVDAEILLEKINSQNMNITNIKSNHLKETFKIFENNKNAKYSVAWIDSTSKGSKLGRGVVSIGKFANDDDLKYIKPKILSIPKYIPSFLINRFTIKLFNFIYYYKNIFKTNSRVVKLDSFFYPLDKIKNWNRVYGENGFIQYQFILPLETSYQGMFEILNKISNETMGSVVTVLKLYGEENNNYLSFPMKGYSLAIDFKACKKTLDFLDNLDQLVIKYKGRIYLAKDARISKNNFGKNYPNIEKFKALREKYGMNKKFQSLQSKRVGI